MALRYPTQPLRVAANTPTFSILHFVDPQDDARPPDFQHRNIQDISRMYNPRTKPLDNTAVTLTTITCWANPPIVDQTIYQNHQILNATTPKIAKEPIRKVLPISAEAPSNPKMAMEIFMKLIAKQIWKLSYAKNSSEYWRTTR